MSVCYKRFLWTTFAQSFERKSHLIFPPKVVKNRKKKGKHNRHEKKKWCSRLAEWILEQKIDKRLDNKQFLESSSNLFKNSNLSWIFRTLTWARCMLAQKRFDRSKSQNTKISGISKSEIHQNSWFCMLKPYFWYLDLKERLESHGPCSNTKNLEHSEERQNQITKNPNKDGPISSTACPTRINPKNQTESIFHEF